MPKIALQPNTSDATIKKLAGGDELVDSIRHTRRVIRIWRAVRDLLATEIEVSGRLTLKHDNGQRVIEWRGVAPIRKQYQVPTLMFDATLPDLKNPAGLPSAGRDQGGHQM